MLQIGAESEVLLLLEKMGPQVGLSSGGVQVLPLFGDGSDRMFFRVRQGESHFVVLISHGQKQHGIDEIDSYFHIGKHLYHHEIPVPRIYWADTERGHFVLEDLGDVHLQRHANRGLVNVIALYRRVLNLLILLHERAPIDFEPTYCFDTVLYDPPFVYSRELEYFRNAFLVGYLGLGVGEDELRSDFENLAEAAGVHQTDRVMHRDFQSRNIMIWRDELKLLDFQGMRYGPPAYDLASLLIDPYVMLPSRAQEQLVGLYRSRAGKFLRCSHSEFMRSYEAVRLCRNLQVLGAYGHLGITKGKRQFFKYIPRAFQQLHESVNTAYRDRYPKIRKWVNLIHRRSKAVQ